MTATLVAPAYLNIPPRTGSYGDEAADLMAMAGRPLDEEQRLAVDAMLSYGPGGRWAALEQAIVEARQNGKALDVSTPLLTANRGWTTMGEARIGDEVFHPGGYPVRITLVSDVMTGHDCYRVMTTDGRSVVADAEHLWTVTDRAVSTSKGRRHEPKIRTYAVKTLTTAELVALGLGRGAPRSNGRNEWRWQLPEQQPLKSADVLLPIDPYLLGAWLGDGSSTSAALSCHSDDADHWIAAVRQCGYVATRTWDRTCERIGITYPEGTSGRQAHSLPAKLRQIGVLGNKHVPEMYLTAGTSQRLALLQGLLDTDGTVDAKRSQVEFCSTRRALADGVLFLARSLGWRATLKTGRAMLRGKDCGAKYRVCFTPVAADGLPPFRLPRKLARLKPADGGAGRHTVSISSIERVDSVSVRCIKVDSPDGLFLAGRDLFATHNTGGVLLPVVLFDLFLMPPDKIVWTAHLFRTAREAFSDVCQIIDGCDMLSKRVKKITYANGEEAVELHSGAVLAFLARSKGGGRGLGGKRIVMDEALFLAAEAMGALMPTLAARSMTADPAITYGASAGVLGSDHLRGLRDRGRKGNDPSLVYLEWCAPGSWDQPGCQDGPECSHTAGAVQGCALDDESLWPKANHALGRRISYDYIRSERRALPPEEFGRERLGWHTDPAGGGLPLERWTECADDASKPVGRPVFMIDASPGSRSAAIVACMYRADGLPHLEVVAHRQGTDWVAERCLELVKHKPLDWVLDPGGPAGGLLPDLLAAGIEPRQMSARDLGQACEAFAAAVTDKALRHLGDPLLARAINGAGRRDIGDGLWAWSRRKSDTDISPLVAATGAHWGLAVQPPPTPPPAAPVVLETEASDDDTFFSTGF